MIYCTQMHIMVTEINLAGKKMKQYDGKAMELFCHVNT